MSRRDDELEQSSQVGRWSFQIQPAQNQVFLASSLLYAQLPTWAARSWTVNLCAMLYSSGPLPRGATIPTANQVNTFTFQVRVVWGNDGALDTVLMYYPWGGCTFTVQGASVRVDILSAAALGADAQPLLAGFLSPVPPVQVVPTSPVLTQGPVVLASGGAANFLFPIPARACAYRPFSGSVVPTLSQVLLEQLEPLALSVVSYDGNFPTSLTADYEMQNRAGFIPVHRSATLLRTTNTSATNTSAVGVQWLLDVG